MVGWGIIAEGDKGALQGTSYGQCEIPRQCCPFVPSSMRQVDQQKARCWASRAKYDYLRLVLMYQNHPHHYCMIVMPLQRSIRDCWRNGKCWAISRVLGLASVWNAVAAVVVSSELKEEQMCFVLWRRVLEPLWCVMETLCIIILLQKMSWMAQSWIVMICDLLPTQAYGFGTHDSIVRTYTVQTGPRVLLWYTVFTILFPFRITLSLAVTCRTSPSHICMSMFSGANERL